METHNFFDKLLSSYYFTFKRIYFTVENRANLYIILYKYYGLQIPKKAIKQRIYLMQEFDFRDGIN